MEYFTFEELKEIKARVLHLHSVFKEVYKKYTKSHVTCTCMLLLYGLKCLFSWLLTILLRTDETDVLQNFK